MSGPMVGSGSLVRSPHHFFEGRRPIISVFQPEQVFRPSTTDEVVDLMAEDPGRTLLLGGGTFIHGLVSRGFLGQINRLVDLGRLDWSNIEVNNGSCHIGSTATFRDVSDNPLSRESWAGAIADSLEYPPPQITNLATIGGSLASASPLFDVPVAFQALGGTVHARGPDGGRDVALDDFFTDYFEHSLKPGEVITRLQMDRPDGPSASALRKCDTNANDLAIVNVAGSVTMNADDSTCREARIVVGGGGASTPLRVPEGERELQGEPLTDNTMDRVSDAVGASLNLEGDFRGSSSYRKHMARVLTRRVLEQIRNRLNGVT